MTTRGNIEAFKPALDRYIDRVRDLELHVSQVGLDSSDAIKAALGRGVEDLVAIEAPVGAVGQTLVDLSLWARDVLEALNSECLQSLSSLRPDALGQYADDGWAFTYRGVRLFALASSSAYDETNSRFSGGSEQTHAMLHLQPSVMFKLRFSTSRLPADRAKAINRQRFAELGMAYHLPGHELTATHKAAKVVLPEYPNKPHLAWWLLQPSQR